MPVSAPFPIVRRLSESEKALYIVLIAATFVYPGLPSVLISAYVNNWLRIKRLKADYIAFSFILLIGFLIFVLTTSELQRNVAEIIGNIISFNFASSVFNLLYLWLLGLLIAPLGGVVMSLWHEIWLKIVLQFQNFDEAIKRSFAEKEKAAIEQVRLAKKIAENKPSDIEGELRLGALVGSFNSFEDELGVRRRQNWITMDESVLDTHMLIVGAPGQGKTETIKRIIFEILANTKRNIVFVDGKGDKKLAEEFQHMVREIRKQEAPVFKLGFSEPGAKYNGFSGDAIAIYDRLDAMATMGTGIGAADHYERINKTILYLICHAPGSDGKPSPPRDFVELKMRLDKDVLKDLYAGSNKLPEVEALSSKDIADLARRLNLIIWQFEDVIVPDGFTIEDTGCCLFSIRTGTAESVAGDLIKFLLKDINDFLGNRQKQDTVFIIDEFGVFDATQISKIFTILAQGRYAKLGAILATQGTAALGSQELREKIIDTTGTRILMSTVNPELIALTAGTVKAWEIGQQIDTTGPTGVGTIREQDTHAIPMNVAANLPRGEGFIIRKRRNVRVHFAPVLEEEIKKRANQSAG